MVWFAGIDASGRLCYSKTLACIAGVDLARCKICIMYSKKWAQFACSLGSTFKVPSRLVVLPLMHCTLTEILQRYFHQPKRIESLLRSW